MYSFQEVEDCEILHFKAIINAFRFITQDERKLYFSIKKRKASGRLEIFGKMQNPVLFAKRLENKIKERASEEFWARTMSQLEINFDNGIWIEVNKRI